MCSRHRDRRLRKLNLLAWLVLAGLGVVAAVAAARLGFVGLVIVGLAVLLVCTLATLNDDVPTWGEHVFRARLEAGRSDPPDLGFYRWCGLGVLLVGVVGLAWTWWK